MYAGTIVETGPCVEVFERQLNPYTWGLLRARPGLTGPVGALNVIPGQPVSGLKAPAGCPFAPRCAWSIDRCAEGARRSSRWRTGAPNGLHPDRGDRR